MAMTVSSSMRVKAARRAQGRGERHEEKLMTGRRG